MKNTPIVRSNPPRVRTIVQFRRWLKLEQIINLMIDAADGRYTSTTDYRSDVATVQFGATSRWTSDILVVATIEPYRDYFQAGIAPDGTKPPLHENIYIQAHSWWGNQRKSDFDTQLRAVQRFADTVRDVYQLEERKGTFVFNQLIKR